jgi:hypothetical protein
MQTFKLDAPNSACAAPASSATAVGGSASTDPSTHKMRRVSLKTTDDKMAKQKGMSFLTIAAGQGMAKLKEVAGCAMTPRPLPPWSSTTRR